MNAKTVFKFLIVVLFAGGICMLLNGYSIRAKAFVAQFLLDRAWEKTVRGGPHVKPWPWADTWPVARLAFPRQGVDLIVLEGESGSTLAFGPGHMAGSARPGTPGNSVICGHRDTSFRFLEWVHIGDLCILETPNGRRNTFKVCDILIEEAAGVRLRVQHDQPLLTLITCYPFDELVPGDLRYLVFAESLGNSPG